MKFACDVNKDLAIFFKAFGKEQIGFARIGDGEETMIFGGRYHCSDGWVSSPGQGTYRNSVSKSVMCDHPNFYLGLRLPKGNRRMVWYFRNVKAPGTRLTDPCLFVNSRWQKSRAFFKKVRPRCVLVGCAKKVDIQIPKDCISPEYDYKPLLAKLLKVKKPILLAAGPLANILVAEYLNAGGKQTIIDMGTVLDMEMFGKPTRKYMRQAIAAAAKRKKKGKKKRLVRRPKRRKTLAKRFGNLRFSIKLKKQRRHK